MNIPGTTQNGIDVDQFVKDCDRQQEEFKEEEKRMELAYKASKNEEPEKFHGKSNIEIMRENELLRSRIDQISLEIAQRNRVIMYILGAISVPVILYIRYRYNKKRDNEKVENDQKA